MKTASQNAPVDGRENASRKAIKHRIIGGAFMFFLAAVFWNLGDTLVSPPAPKLSIAVSQPPQDADIYQENVTPDVEDISAFDENASDAVVVGEDSDDAGNQSDVSVNDANDAKYQEDKIASDKAADSLGENEEKPDSGVTIFAEETDDTAADAMVLVVVGTYRDPQNAVIHRDKLASDGFAVTLKEVKVKDETMKQVGIWANRAEVSAVKKELDEWLRYSSTTPTKKESSYDVQVFASPTLEKAQEEYKKLQDIGYKVRIKRQEIAGTVFYKVRVTGFNNKDEATVGKRKLLKDKRLTNQQRKDYKGAYVNTNK